MKFKIGQKVKYEDLESIIMPYKFGDITKITKKYVYIFCPETQQIDRITFDDIIEIY